MVTCLEADASVTSTFSFASSKFGSCRSETGWVRLAGTGDADGASVNTKVDAAGDLEGMSDGTSEGISDGVSEAISVGGTDGAGIASVGGTSGASMGEATGGDVGRSSGVGAKTAASEESPI